MRFSHAQFRIAKVRHLSHNQLHPGLTFMPSSRYDTSYPVTSASSQNWETINQTPPPTISQNTNPIARTKQQSGFESDSSLNHFVKSTPGILRRSPKVNSPTTLRIRSSRKFKKHLANSSSFCNQRERFFQCERPRSPGRGERG